ncbi:hypothetical protein STEG23_021964, partial [Scotinomys teguina]
MDVFHFAEFGKLKYVHDTINTYPGFQWATGSNSEKAGSVTTHLLEVVAIMGIPAQIKTDNVPAYVSDSPSFLLPPLISPNPPPFPTSCKSRSAMVHQQILVHYIDPSPNLMHQGCAKCHTLDTGLPKACSCTRTYWVLQRNFLLISITFRIDMFLHLPPVITKMPIYLKLEDNEENQLRNLKTTEQMRHLKKKDEPSRENILRKRVNWPIDTYNGTEEKPKLKDYFIATNFKILRFYFDSFKDIL